MLEPATDRQESAASPQTRDGDAGIPAPAAGERPAAYADRVGEWHVGRTSKRQRREHGLYLTPVPVADFMAGLARAEGKSVRVLDPAAGTGILGCAAVEAMAAGGRPPRDIELVAYETDRSLLPPLRAVLRHLADWCLERHGIRLSARVEGADFILAHAEALRPPGEAPPCRGEGDAFDLVILNPPYFKIGKTDPRAAAAAKVANGQPNIYALFMAAGAALLREGGGFVSITPRSFASGSYFRRFRDAFFSMIRPLHVHAFESRRDAFRRDDVLQENVVLAGTRKDNRRRPAPDLPLAVSSSGGVRDIAAARRHDVPLASAMPAPTDGPLRLPLSKEALETLDLVDSWPGTLQAYGLNISTGPVVAFRAAGLISRTGRVPDTHAPLLWMQHVRAMEVSWPLKGRKPEYIRRGTGRHLLPADRNYVLLRRFSAKEEKRRLTAAPCLAGGRPGREIGIENHLNYIHRPGGTLSPDEAWGLAALFSSRLLDAYFRCVSGNTQVSATELRAMPLPAHAAVAALGRRARSAADPLADVDDWVADMAAGRDMREATVG